MTFNPAEYHPDWAWISRQIKDQAGNCCERCGVANGAYGARDLSGTWHDEYQINNMNYDVGINLFGDEWDGKMVRIVLTVHHECRDKSCIDPTHLFALCQRCHLNADRDLHMAKAAATRQRKRNQAIAATGQLTMEVG